MGTSYLNDIRWVKAGSRHYIVDKYEVFVSIITLDIFKVSQIRVHYILDLTLHVVGLDS